MQRRVVKGSKWRKIEAKVAKPPRHVEEKERSKGRGRRGREAFKRSKKMWKKDLSEKWRECRENE